MPAANEDEPSAGNQFPKWRYSKEKGSVESVEFIECHFQLDQSEVKAIEQSFGKGIILSPRISIARAYSGDVRYEIEIDESAAVKHSISSSSLSKSEKAELFLAQNYDELDDLLLERIDNLDEGSDEFKAFSDLRENVSELVYKEHIQEKVFNKIWEFLPEFIYFSNYSILPGDISLDIVEGKLPKSGFTSEQIDTVKSLLKLANANIETLRSSDFEEMTTEIESVSANLSEQVFEYWHQNDSLSVSAVINPVAITDEHGTQRIEKRLSLRIRDDSRKSYSCSFEDRSTGFKWFFSFFAAFGCYSDQKRTAIVLLDEPALSLHGKAQADFLSFINDRLAPYVQVIYTTHSPFMVETNKSHRIRLVEDRGGEVGVSISDQSLAVEASSDTVFPLQAALGYDIAQSMFIGNKNLALRCF